MIAVLVCVALAALAAAVVILDVKPWRLPPVIGTLREVTVTITVDTEAFQEAIARAAHAASAMRDAWARTGPTFAEASARMEELGRALWLDAYERTKNWPAPTDPPLFPRLRPFRWLP